MPILEGATPKIPIPIIPSMDRNLYPSNLYSIHHGTHKTLRDTHHNSLLDSHHSIELQEPHGMHRQNIRRGIPQSTHLDNHRHGIHHGILRLRDQVLGKPPAGWRERYEATGTEELLPDAGARSAEINVFAPGDTAGA